MVEAKDGGTPALSAVATVSIGIADVNDNPPSFNQDVYSAVVSEDAAVGDSVALVGGKGGPGQNRCHRSVPGCSGPNPAPLLLQFML